MGFRTIVSLSNDDAHIWQADPQLGRKIMVAGNYLGELKYNLPPELQFTYGDVVEVVHSDVQSLIVANGYTADTVTHTHWYPKQTKEDMELSLLKLYAGKLGYRVSKIPTKKA